LHRRYTTVPVLLLLLQVGVATPAVLTEALAADCSDYITSVVLMVR
jgi:hypothetical protein